MTSASTPDYAHQAFYASHRPVRRFVAALIVAVVVVGLIWWAGLLAPRLTSEVSAGQFNPASQMGVLELEIRNQTPTPVRIQDAGFLGGADVQAASVDGQDLDHGPEIAGRSTSILRLEYRADTCLADPPGNTIGLRLNVRTVVGATKTERLYPFLPTSAPSNTC